jgi:hypothetical protein
MITVNSLSGGKTSSYMALHFPADINIFACVCIDHKAASPKDPAILKYATDKLKGNFIASAEHEKTLKVMLDLEQALGSEVVWVRGKSFDEIIDNAGCLPTWKRRFCTTELKIIPIFEYTYFRFGKVKMNIGYRADEPERINSGKKNTLMKYPTSVNTFGTFRQKWEEIDWRENEFPLYKTFHFEIIKFFKKNFPGILFPPDSNCMGCHHKPPNLISQNHKETPEVLDWFAMQEEKKKNKGLKIHTWHDDKVSYREIFKMNFTEEIDFDFTMCNSGGCTD